MELSELDAELVQDEAAEMGRMPDKEWINADPLDDDEQAIIDIKEAIALFTTVKTLLDFLGNPLLCKAVSKRERDTLGKVSEEVRTFLASVEPTYSEEEGYE